VFKVETIGDCYVAVTGVPEVQVDHAVVMAKFATECLLKLRHVLSKMGEKYGEETLELTMRIGSYNKRGGTAVVVNMNVITKFPPFVCPLLYRYS
jgi:class 3 adenylate cyclase